MRRKAVNSHNNLWRFCNLFAKEIGKSMQLPHLLTSSPLVFKSYNNVLPGVICAPEKPSITTTTPRYGLITYVNSHNNLWHFWNLFAEEVDTSICSLHNCTPFVVNSHNKVFSVVTYAPEKPSTTTTTLRYRLINYVNSHNNLWHFCNLFAKEIGKLMQLAHLLTPLR